MCTHKHMPVCVHVAKPHTFSNLITPPPHRLGLQFGLPGEWVLRLVKLDPERRQVLRVRSCVANSHAQQVLKDGDMVLAIAGQPISSFHDVERLIAEYTPPPPDDGAAGAAAAGGMAAEVAAADGPAVDGAAAADRAEGADGPAAKRRRTSENGGWVGGWMGGVGWGKAA